MDQSPKALLLSVERKAFASKGPWDEQQDAAYRRIHLGGKDYDIIVHRGRTTWYTSTSPVGPAGDYLLSLDVRLDQPDEGPDSYDDQVNAIIEDRRVFRSRASPLFMDEGRLQAMEALVMPEGNGNYRVRREVMEGLHQESMRNQLAEAMGQRIIRPNLLHIATPRYREIVRAIIESPQRQ